MSNVVDYIIVAAENPTMLTQAVKVKITEGWQPWDELNITQFPDGSALNLYQVMVKYWPPLDDFEPNKGKETEKK